MAYEQDNYDKRFVEVIDLLLYTREKHRLVENQKDLLLKINLAESSFSMIKKGNRGVPRERRVELTMALEKTFNVNPKYLVEGKLPRTFFVDDLLNEDLVVYKTAQQELEEVRGKLSDCLETVKVKDGIIADLKYVIEELKKV
jgi:hypothetical protein